jgi:hypothetical protein
MGSNWQEIYQAAVLETDRDKLAQKIDSALVLLQNQIHELSSSGHDSMERQRMTDALLTLETIRRIEIQIPCSVTNRNL